MHLYGTPIYKDDISNEICLTVLNDNCQYVYLNIVRMSDLIAVRLSDAKINYVCTRLQNSDDRQRLRGQIRGGGYKCLQALKRKYSTSSDRALANVKIKIMCTDNNITHCAHGDLIESKLFVPLMR